MTAPTIVRRDLIRFLSLSAVALGVTLPAVPALSADVPKDQTILNATYDIGRELFSKINPLFLEHWQKQHGSKLKIDQSFGGTSRQAQDIIQGKKADTVTFNQVTDIDILARRKLVKPDWAEQFPNNSSPYYSTIAFMVRKGNPKGIKNWDDLAKPDTKLIFPNPKTSGNARYSYLGAWIYAQEAFKGDEAAVKQFITSLLGNVENFPTGGRAATVAFTQHGQGDVLLTFESEIKNLLADPAFKDQGYELVVPPVSVLAEFPVAIVDKVVDAKGTREVAKAYLDFQYSPDVQQLLADHNLRPSNAEVAAANAKRFDETRLVNPTSLQGGWAGIQKDHFASGATLDQLMAARRR
ncbi:MAG: thiosulfate ABC transporter substrate-binding protein CysP [Lautropia sp.]|nr:thiosulfate ABC transporter substrate-binding protein CysP [Lautropia sp.]